MYGKYPCFQLIEEKNYATYPGPEQPKHIEAEAAKGNRTVGFLR